MENKHTQITINSGEYSTAINSGYGSTATGSGYKSVAKNTGLNGLCVSTGKRGGASGVKGTIVFLVERGTNYEILNHISFEIDGEKYKENTLYTLVGGEVIEAEKGE